jgi:hypothetical protein
MALHRIEKDTEWQKIKVILTGEWHNPVKNIGMLREYLGDFSDSARIRRVMNYLTAFRSDGRGQVEICDLLRDIKIKREDLNDR